MKIQGVLFDLDGTIVNSEPSRLKSSNIVLNEYNLRISDYEWNIKYKKISSIEMFNDIIKRNNLDVNSQELYNKAHKIRENIEKKEKIMLIKGFKRFYKYLLEHNIKLIICSGGKREHIELLLNKINLTNVQYLGREDYSRRKPFPDAWLKGLKVLELEADEVILFDDSYTGILAGKKAGIKNLIAINTGAEVGIKELEPKQIIKDFTELDLNIF